MTWQRTRLARLTAGQSRSKGHHRCRYFDVRRHVLPAGGHVAGWTSSGGAGAQRLVARGLAPMVFAAGFFATAGFVAVLVAATAFVVGFFATTDRVAGFFATAVFVAETGRAAGAVFLSVIMLQGVLSRGQDGHGCDRDRTTWCRGLRRLYALIDARMPHPRSIEVAGHASAHDRVRGRPAGWRACSDLTVPHGAARGG